MENDAFDLLETQQKMFKKLIRNWLFYIQEAIIFAQILPKSPSISSRATNMWISKKTHCPSSTQSTLQVYRLLSLKAFFFFLNLVLFVLLPFWIFYCNCSEGRMDQDTNKCGFSINYTSTLNYMASHSKDRVFQITDENVNYSHWWWASIDLHRFIEHLLRPTGKNI